MAAIPARYIILHRAEGFQYEIQRPEVVCSTTSADVWTKANDQLRHWSWNAPNNGAYQKTDITVVFADGATYRMSFNLTRTTIDPDLKRRVWEQNAYYAGLNRPANTDEAAYQALLAENPERTKRAKEFLERYDVEVNVGSGLR